METVSTGNHKNWKYLIHKQFPLMVGVSNLEILAEMVVAADEASSMHLHSSVGHSPLPPERSNQTLINVGSTAISDFTLVGPYWEAVGRFWPSQMQEPSSWLLPTQVGIEPISGKATRRVRGQRSCCWSLARSDIVQTGRWCRLGLCRCLLQRLVSMRKERRGGNPLIQARRAH